MRTEDARGIALARPDRSGMVEQRAELPDGDRKVGPEQAFTEELEERAAGRGAEEGGPAGVAGGVPGVLVDAERILTSAANIGGSTDSR